MSSGAAEALLQREAGLVDQRDQDPVDQEARAVLARDRRLAELRHQRQRHRVGVVAGLQPADDLDQLHHRHRVHEVHPDHALGAPVTAASSVMLIELVLLARIAPGRAALSSSINSFFLSSMFSVAASIRRSPGARPPRRPPP
jgi:hypothetical protein